MHVRTPADAVATFQALADVGIEYFLVQSFDVGDQETLRLLAEEVAPRVRVSAPATHRQHAGYSAATLGRPVDRSHEVDVATNPVVRCRLTAEVSWGDLQL